MEQQTAHNEIIEKLNQLQSDIEVLKQRLPVDPDTIMTEEEEKELEEALEAYKRGETYTLEDIERERENAGLGI